MRLETLPSEFQKALPILEKIKDQGFEAYFVGGSVRDAILGRPIHDVDIATSAYPAEIKEIFRRTIDVGIDHGTVLVLDDEGEYEITTFRTEEAYVDYRRPSQVHFVQSLEEDLKRRDFTVNALALDERAQVVDLFGGIKDLQEGRLRAVGIPVERFEEDALRIMRGFRFAASLDFRIAPETLAAMESHAPLLDKISVERLFVEMDKLLLASSWQIGLGYLLETGAQAYLPDLAQKRESLGHLCQVLPKGYRFTGSEQAWAFLCVHLGIREPQSFLKKWKTSSQFQKTVSELVAIYGLRDKRDFTKQDVYTYGLTSLQEVEALRQAEGHPVDFEALLDLHASLTIHHKQDIVVTGRHLIEDLGFKQGMVLGEVLKAVEEAIVAGELANNKQAIFDFINEVRGTYE